jgi:hypothetical protein
LLNGGNVGKSFGNSKDRQKAGKVQMLLMRDTPKKSSMQQVQNSKNKKGAPSIPYRQRPSRTPKALRFALEVDMVLPSRSRHCAKIGKILLPRLPFRRLLNKYVSAITKMQGKT